MLALAWMMDDEAFSRYERRVRELVAFGHRGSATEQERQAAKYLATELRRLGLAPAEERFDGSRSFGVRLLVHVGVAAAGAALLGRRPRAGAALGALALGSLIWEQRTRGSLLSRPFTRAGSCNVVARLPARSGPPQGRVIVCGHYDTQRTGLLWSTGMMERLAPLLCRNPPLLRSALFPVSTAMAAQCLEGVFLGPAGGGAALARRAGLIGLVYAVAAALLADWAVGEHVPGAGDNASGAAAVLSLAEQWLADPVPGVELVLLFTGSEETGLLGAAAWAERHREELRAMPALFLNLDSLGMGPPRFIGCEVPAAGLPIAYPAPLLELCRAVARELGLVNAGPHPTFGPTDGLAFLARGLAGVTVIGSGDQGQLAHYHQMTDTPEQLDFRAAWQGAQFAGRLLPRLAAMAEGAARDDRAGLNPEPR